MFDKINNGSKYYIDDLEGFFEKINETFSDTGVTDEEIEFFSNNKQFSVCVTRTPSFINKDSLYGISFVGIETGFTYNNDYKQIHLDFFHKSKNFIHEEMEI